MRTGLARRSGTNHAERQFREEIQMRPALTLLMVTTLLLGCAVFGGEISELHRPVAKGDPSRPDQSRGHDEVGRTDHGVTEVGLERSPCFGTCPVYTVLIKSDGTFRYKGVSNAQRQGDHTGKVSTYEFNQLAQFIKDSGYSELQDSYSRMVTDHPTVYTTVIIGGKRKVVSNYANAGPTKLWAVEELIDKLLLEATWDDKPSPQK
jgi:hypothetical protein